MEDKTTHAEINEPVPPDILELTDEEKIEAFRSMLEAHAKEHSLSITDIKSWTDSKIKWMALHDNQCCCSPDRTCPCEEGIYEARNEQDHMCLCSIFKHRYTTR